jgi:hypothetical protein
MARAFAASRGTTSQELFMSYSISARGATKLLALAALAVAFDAQVLASQPVHETDKASALAAAEAFAQHVKDDESKDVVINLNGYLSWEQAGDDAERKFTGASVGVSVNLVAKEEPK